MLLVPLHWIGRIEQYILIGHDYLFRMHYKKKESFNRLVEYASLFVSLNDTMHRYSNVNRFVRYFVEQVVSEYKLH